MPAFERAGDPQYRPDLGEPWAPAKLYYTLWSRQRIEGRHKAFQDLGLESPYSDWWFKRPSTDDQITTQVPVDGFIDAAHRGPAGPRHPDRPGIDLLVRASGRS